MAWKVCGGLGMDPLGHMTLITARLFYFTLGKIVAYVVKVVIPMGAHLSYA